MAVKKTLVASETTNHAIWYIYKCADCYQAEVKHRVLINKFRTRRLKTLTLAAAQAWITEQL